MTVYCVWAWDQYYPKGGNGNLVGIYTTQEAAEEAEKNALKENYDYTRITQETVQ